VQDDPSSDDQLINLEAPASKFDTMTLDDLNDDDFDPRAGDQTGPSDQVKKKPPDPDKYNTESGSRGDPVSGSGSGIGFSRESGIGTNFGSFRDARLFSNQMCTVTFAGFMSKFFLQVYG
jgi:hypothetical protein